MEICISIGALVILAVFYPVFAYIHCPKEQCSGEVKDLIMSKGLTHFTTIENAERIQREGLKPGKKKAMYPREKNFVWMYINEADEFQAKLDLIHSKGERKEYNAVVVFQGITESQISRMKYRKKDMAVIYDGEFTTERISMYKLGADK